MRDRTSRVDAMTLEECLLSFDQDPRGISRRMYELLNHGREDFVPEARTALQRVWFSRGTPHFLAMAVLTPSLLSFSSVIALIRDVQVHDPLAGVKAARVIAQDPCRMSPAVSLRVLSLLGATTELTRVLPLLTTFLRHEDVQVRSKTALLLGRANRSVAWVARMLDDPTPRTRANAVEAVWGLRTPDAIAVFRRAAADADNRVSANGILGLCLAGDAAAPELLAVMSRHESDRFRASAAWVIGELADRQFTPILNALRNDPDPKVRFAALRSLARLRRTGAGENRDDMDGLARAESCA